MGSLKCNHRQSDVKQQFADVEEKWFEVFHDNKLAHIRMLRDHFAECRTFYYLKAICHSNKEVSVYLLSRWSQSAR